MGGGIHVVLVKQRATTYKHDLIIMSSNNVMRMRTYYATIMITSLEAGAGRARLVAMRRRPAMANTVYAHARFVGAPCSPADVAAVARSYDNSYRKSAAASPFARWIQPR